jgi:hypothetical protein
MLADFDRRDMYARARSNRGRKSPSSVMAAQCLDNQAIS